MTDKEYIVTADYILGVLRAMIDGSPLPEKPLDVSFRMIYSLSKHHSLASTIYHYIENEVKKEGDTALIAAWQKERDVDFVKNLKQKDEFRRITELFTDEKISFLPLKGFLMKALYPRPELRTMADMDIFVSEEHIERAINLLLDRGYVCEHEIDDEGVHEALAKPPFINVELHRHLYQGSDFSFSDAKPKEDNPYWYLMEDSDFFAFILRHSKKHYTHGGCGMRAVLDIFLYKRKNPELITSEDFINKLKENDLYEFYVTISALADKWFLGKEPETDISEFEIYTVTGGTYGTLANSMGFGMKEHGRFRYVFGRIFPSPKLIMQRYKWVRKCVILLPVGYIVRIVQSIFNGRAKSHVDAISESNKREKKNNKNGSV